MESLLFFALLVTVPPLEQDRVEFQTKLETEMKNFATDFVRSYFVPECPSEGHNNESAKLIIGSFNVKNFGRTKMSKEPVAKHLTCIISRYDVLLIQEVHDSSGQAIKDLWSRLNETDQWGLAISERLGRKKFKEQYGFFYRLSKIELTGTYQYTDVPLDVYEREPFAAELEFWSAESNTTKRLVLISLHVKPSDAKEELSHFPVAIRAVANQFPFSDGVIALGDLNADCTYFSATERRNSELFNSSSEFVSLISDLQDTTVSKTNCAYDRVLVYNKTGSSVSPDVANVFRFDLFLGLNEKEALSVSDHYPVEFELQ